MYVIIWNFCVFAFIVAPGSHNVHYHFHLQLFMLSFLFLCSSPYCVKGFVSWLFWVFAFLFFVLVSVLVNQFVVLLFIHINHYDVLIKVWWRTIYILLYFWAFILSQPTLRREGDAWLAGCVYELILDGMHDCDGVCVSFHEFEQVCMLDKERTRMWNCIYNC